ncbi:hypothetical protein A2U01_0017256, partial [Trifolium medium]|nr:hypothetical protein [Trifolium medium]
STAPKPHQEANIDDFLKPFKNYECVELHKFDQMDIVAAIGRILKEYNKTQAIVQSTKSEPSSSDLASSEPAHSELPNAPPVSNPKLANICNNIIKRVEKLHKLRYSFTEPYAYLSAWETLRNEINLELDNVQNGDLNELIAFQDILRSWIKEVNKIIEVSLLKKKGRLSLTEKFFYEETVTNTEIAKNPEMEAFKSEVRDDLSAQKLKLQELSAKQEVMYEKQEAMCAKQEEMSADLKAILSLLQNRNP